MRRLTRLTVPPSRRHTVHGPTTLACESKDHTSTLSMCDVSIKHPK